MKNENTKQKKPDTAFGARLREVLGGIPNAEILRKYGKELGVDSESAVSNYMSSKGRYPKVEGLIRLSQIVGFNLDYVLTGRGDPKADPYGFIEPQVRDAIQKLANIYGPERDFEGVLNAVLVDGLKARAALIFSFLQSAQPEEMEAFDVLVQLVRRELAAKHGEMVQSQTPARTARR